METMGQRLQEALTRRGIQPPDLINHTKLSKGTIYNILNDTTRPEKVWAVTVDKICRYLAISRDWLIYGHGAMSPDPTTTLEPGTSSQTLRLDPVTIAEAVKLWRSRMAVRDVKITVADLEEDGTGLAAAYQFLAGRRARGESADAASNVVQFSDYLRAQGAKADGQLVQDGGSGRSAGRQKAS